MNLVFLDLNKKNSPLRGNAKPDFLEIFFQEFQTFLSVIAVINLLFLGNLLTVVALLRCPKLRSHATTLFVISLAISDLLFAAINLPLTASRYIHERWTFPMTLCR